MNRFFQVGVPLVLALALVGTYSYVTAQGRVSRPGMVETEPPVFHTLPSASPQVATKHFLQATYLSVGNGSGTAISASTYTPVDTPLTVTCPGPVGTCTLLANQFVETRGSAASNNLAICFYVDGALIPHGCYYTNDTPSDGTFDQGATSSWEVGVPVGTHTVQTVIYSNFGCNLYDYNLQYLVYEP